MKPEGGIRRYHSGMLPFAVDVYLDTYNGPSWVKQQLRGRCGWLRVSKASLRTPISDWTATIAAAITDDGRQLGKVSSAACLAMRSSSPQECFDDPPNELEAITEMLFWDFLGGCDLRHLDMLAEGEAEIVARVAVEQARGEKVLAEVDAYLTMLRRRRRDPDCGAEERRDLDGRIAQLDEKHSAAAHWLVRRLAAMRDERTQLEADVWEAIENHGEIEELYNVRWVARSQYDRCIERALMVNLTQTGSLPGVPMERRLDAEDRWELAEAARKKLSPVKFIQPTKRKRGRADDQLRSSPRMTKRPSPNQVEPGQNTAGDENKQILAPLADWQDGEWESGTNTVEVEARLGAKLDNASATLLPIDADEAPSPGGFLVQTTTAIPHAAAPDDSAADIAKMIERDMRDLVKDLKLP